MVYCMSSAVEEQGVYAVLKSINKWYIILMKI